MDVILLQDVEKVGLRGEVVDVARGYARNYLLPRRLAEPATPARAGGAASAASELRARHEAADGRAGAGDRADARKTELRFDVKAGPTGALFGSVTPTDIADELWDARRSASTGARSTCRADQADRPLRGPDRAVHRRLASRCATLVVPEGGELPPEEELQRPRRPRPPRRQPRGRAEEDRRRGGRSGEQPAAETAPRRPSRARRTPTPEQPSRAPERRRGAAKSSPSRVVFHSALHRPVEKCDEVSAPARTSRRGLWTWGHRPTGCG